MKTLSCGNARFTAYTRRSHDYVTAQEMWVRPAGSGQKRQIDLRQSTFVLHRVMPGLRVVADEVSFWACKKASNARALILMYDCSQLLPENIPSKFCSKTGEWYRYIGIDGTLLDKGFQPGEADPREDVLRRRLGLLKERDEPAFHDIQD